MRGAFIIAIVACAALPAAAGVIMPLGAPSFSKPVGAQQNEYIATFSSQVAVSGAVNAGGIVWKCGGNQCVTYGPWPVPGVGSCNALALQEGYVTSYGYSAAQLTKDQLAGCNNGVANNALPKPMGMNPYQGFKTQQMPSPKNQQGSKDSGMAPPPGSAPFTAGPPAASGPPYSIRTATFSVTGTGSAAARLPFTLVVIRTATFQVAGGTASVSTFTPRSIRTQTFTVSGRGSP